MGKANRSVTGRILVQRRYYPSRFYKVVRETSRFVFVHQIGTDMRHGTPVANEGVTPEIDSDGNVIIHRVRKPYDWGYAVRGGFSFHFRFPGDCDDSTVWFWEQRDPCRIIPFHPFQGHQPVLSRITGVWQAHVIGKEVSTGEVPEHERAAYVIRAQSLARPMRTWYILTDLSGWLKIDEITVYHSSVGFEGGYLDSMENFNGADPSVIDQENIKDAVMDAVQRRPTSA